MVKSFVMVPPLNVVPAGVAKVPSFLRKSVLLLVSNVTDEVIALFD